MYSDPYKYINSEPENKSIFKKSTDLNSINNIADETLCEAAISACDGPSRPGRWYWVGKNNFINLCNEFKYKIITEDLDIDKTNPITLFTK